MQTNGYWYTLIYFRNPVLALRHYNAWIHWILTVVSYCIFDMAFITFTNLIIRFKENQRNWVKEERRHLVGDWFDLGQFWNTYVSEACFCKLFPVLFYTNFVREQKNSADADFSRLWKLNLFFLASFPGKIFCFSSRVMKVQNFFLPVMMVEKRVK